jgi:nicotinamide-nucleotide amidase
VTAGAGQPEDGPAGAGSDQAGSGLAGAGPVSLARQAIELLIAGGRTVATAESLTGGLVAAALTSVAGSSAAFRGSIVAYATELKTALLGVPADLLRRQGPVDPDVALAMAGGVRRRLESTYGLATTGVAGPGPADGQDQGTVFIAVDGPAGAVSSGLSLPGDRRQVREATVEAVLLLLVRALREDLS